MANLLDVAVFVILLVLLLQLAHRESLRTQDVQVWTDDIERRMLR